MFQYGIHAVGFAVSTGVAVNDKGEEIPDDPENIIKVNVTSNGILQFTTSNLEGYKLLRAKLAQIVKSMESVIEGEKKKG